MGNSTFFFVFLPEPVNRLAFYLVYTDTKHKKGTIMVQNTIGTNNDKFVIIEREKKVFHLIEFILTLHSYQNIKIH